MQCVEDLVACGYPQLRVYVLDKNGRYAGCSLWSGAHYALHDGKRARKMEAAWLLKRKEEGEETNR